MKILRAVSVVLIIILVISSVSCTDPSNGETDTTGPTIIVDDFNLSEGETITINATVTDQSGVKTVNIQNENYTFISNFSNPNYAAMVIPIDPDFNGTTTFTISAEDNNGNKSSITKTVYVQPTMDLRFYDMPDSISMQDGETKTVNGKIEDDYSALENITLSPSCSHATVQINKLTGDSFEIIIIADQPETKMNSKDSGFTGETTIEIQASDEEGNSNSYSIPLTINEIPNENPEITAPTSVSFNEGQTYSFNIDVSDDNDSIDDLLFMGNCIQYDVGYVKIDSDTMQVNLSPKAGQENYNGTTNLEIIVEDSNGGSTTANVTLNVNDTPDLVFYDMPVSVSMQDGETKTVSGKIEDDYSTLENIALTPSCDHATVQINKLTGDSFEIIIIADHPETGINERDSGFTGETTVEIHASDEEENSNSYSIPLTINEIPNENPEITAPTSVSFNEGQTYSFNIDVSDDNDSIDDLLFMGNCIQYDVGYVKIDSDTMQVNLSPKAGQENYNGTTNLEIIVEDSDGGNATENVTLNVNDTPDLVFYDMPVSISMQDGETKTVSGKIEDDYSTLENIALTPSCSHATVQINKLMGDSFEIIIIADHPETKMNSKDSGFTGETTIEIQASDEEGNSNSYSIPLTINEIPNENPEITAPTSVDFDEGQNYSFNIDVHDDNDSIDDLIFIGNCTQYDVDFLKIDSDAMRVNLSPKTGQENYNGTTNLEIIVEDSDGGSTTANVTLNVNDTPDLVFYDMPVSVSMQDGETKTVSGKIEDDYSTLENIALTPSCDHATVQINKLTGDSFEIIIIADQPETKMNSKDSGFTGETTIEIQASDEEGNSNSYSIPLTINEIPNENPEITAPTSVSFNEGQTYSFNIDVSDDNDSIDDLLFMGNCIQYDVGYVKIDSDTMQVNLSPKAGQENYNGTTNLEIIVEDSNGGSTTANVTLNVNDTPDLVFYDMPVSVSMQDGETKTVSGKIEDDYSTLENIALTPSCDHATVQINKLTGDSFEIIIIADHPETKMNSKDSGFTGETTIEIQASDEEGNSNSYSIPLTINEIPNENPEITAPTSVSFNEGQTYSFNIDVSDDNDSIDDLLFMGNCIQYDVGYVKIDSDAMQVNLSPKAGQENYNGTTNLEINVEDSDGESTTANVTLSVNDTPDLVFYDMPDSISMIDGETKSVNGKIEDDYSTLSNITLSPSCSHATVQINKLMGDSFEIIIIADQPETKMNERDSGFTGETTVEIHASDEEENSNSYSISLTIDEIPNENPIITGPTSVSFNEGRAYSFNIDVSDDRTNIEDMIFTGINQYYNAQFVQVDSNTMQVNLENKEGQGNYYGVSVLTIGVQDNEGGSATKQVQLNVQDTEDVRFYNMPASVAVQDGQSKTVDAYIKDDYTSLENLVLAGTSEHGHVTVAKKTGDKFQITFEANTGYIGSTAVQMEAQDEEGNSATYTVPVTIIPTVEKINIGIDWDGIDLIDNDSNGTTDDYQVLSDLGNALISIYKVPVTNLNFSTQSYTTNDDGKELVMAETAYDTSQRATFNLDKLSVNEWVYEVNVTFPGSGDWKGQMMTYRFNPSKNINLDDLIMEEVREGNISMGADTNHPYYFAEFMIGGSGPHTPNTSGRWISDITFQIIKDVPMSEDMEEALTIGIPIYFPNANVEYYTSTPSVWNEGTIRVVHGPTAGVAAYPRQDTQDYVAGKMYLNFGAEGIGARLTTLNELVSLATLSAEILKGKNMENSSRLTDDNMIPGWESPELDLAQLLLNRLSYNPGGKSSGFSGDIYIEGTKGHIYVLAITAEDEGQEKIIYPATPYQDY